MRIQFFLILLYLPLYHYTTPQLLTIHLVMKTRDFNRNAESVLNLCLHKVIRIYNTHNNIADISKAL